VPPGLDATAPFSSRLSARSALYTELHILLNAIEAEPPAATSRAGLRALVVRDNLLARGSASARAKAWTELTARYRLDTEDPLFVAFLAEWRRCSSEAERALLAYVLFALNDRLVMVLGVDWLFPLLRRAPADVRAVDVLAFIQRARAEHPEIGGWSEATCLAVAQKYGSSIRDFGLASGIKFKATVRPALYGAPVRLLVKALRLAGLPLLDVVRAPAFRLLGVDTTEVIDALGELNREGALRFRMQADVIELDVTEST